MKKLIAILVVLALSLSVAPVALAGTNSYAEISGVTVDEYMCSMQVDFATPITKGQSVSLDFRPHLLSDEAIYNGLSIRFFNAADKGVDVKPEEYDDNGNVTLYYAEHIVEEFCEEGNCTITQGYDDWFTVTFTVASDMPEGFFIRFYYGDKVDYEAGTTLVFDFDNLKVGNKACSFNETNVTAIGELNTATFKFDDGTEFTAAKAFQMDWTMALKTEESTNPAVGDTATPAPDAGENNDDKDNDTNEPTDDSAGANKAWIIVGAVVGVALVAAVVIIVVAKKKK